MLFIDASVIVAIIGREEDADNLLDRLENAEGPYYVSPVVRMEATLALTRQFAEATGPNKPATVEMVEKSRRLVSQFIADLEAQEIVITGEIGTKALDAAQTHGKIINHRAKLNLGDCFTYACARANGAKIAFKGDDFTHTDLGW